MPGHLGPVKPSIDGIHTQCGDLLASRVSAVKTGRVAVFLLEDGPHYDQSSRKYTF